MTTIDHRPVKQDDIWFGVKSKVRKILANDETPKYERNYSIWEFTTGKLNTTSHLRSCPDRIFNLLGSIQLKYLSI